MTLHSSNAPKPEKNVWSGYRLASAQRDKVILHYLSAPTFADPRAWSSYPLLLLLQQRHQFNLPRRLLTTQLPLNLHLPPSFPPPSSQTNGIPPPPPWIPSPLLPNPRSRPLDPLRNPNPLPTKTLTLRSGRRDTLDDGHGELQDVFAIAGCKGARV